MNPLVSPWTGAALTAPQLPLTSLPRVVPGNTRVFWPGLLRLSAFICEPKHRAAGVDLLIHEAGKTRADANAEMDLLPKKIQVTLDALTNDGQSVAGQPVIVKRPRGLALVLGPFNFPVHLLHGLVVPGLATGNPIIAKFSERCPGLAHWYAHLIDKSGLTPGCTVTVGGAEVASRLLDLPDLATVALVGSYRTASIIAAKLRDRPHVSFAAEMGGVNPAILLDDADLSTAVPIILDGAFRMAGQRCTATRVLKVPRPMFTQVVEQLIGLLSTFQPDGTPDGPIGPLIDKAARDAAVACLGNPPPGWRVVGGQSWGEAGLTPALAIQEGSHPWARLADELFAPVLRIEPYDELDTTVRELAAAPYRLAAAVWTKDRLQFDRLAPYLPYGQLYHNRNTAGARGDLPFGGCGHSGNGHAAGLAAMDIFRDPCVVW